MDEKNFSLPNDRLYDDNYTWVLAKEDTAKLGIVKPAADLVREFVFISLPKKGKMLKKGEVYVSVEAVKWSGHMKSPFTGMIIDVNELLFDEPSKINRNPYEEWIVKIKMSSQDELKGLMDAEERMKKPLQHRK